MHVLFLFIFCFAFAQVQGARPNAFFLCMLVFVYLGTRYGREARDQNTITTINPPIPVRDAFPRYITEKKLFSLNDGTFFLLPWEGVKEGDPGIKIQLPG